MMVPLPLGLLRILRTRCPPVRFVRAAVNPTAGFLEQYSHYWGQFASTRCLSTQSGRWSQQEAAQPYNGTQSTGDVPYEVKPYSLLGNKMVDFSRPEIIYRSKRSSELVRAFLVLQLSSFDRFVQNSPKLMALGQRILRKRLFEGVMRWTFFGQFAMEEHIGQVQVQKQRLEDCGIASMFAVTAEEDVGENIGIFNEERYDRNVDRMLYCLELTEHLCRVRDWPRLTQLKITSYMNADVLAKISRLIGEQQGDFQCAGSVSLDNFVSGLDGEPMKRIPECSGGEMEHVQKALLRFNHIAERSADLGIHVLADAEKANINPSISLVILAMMKKFNQSQAMVWSTYQCYLKVTEANLKRDALLADEEGFCFGVKLVRGAYMDGEKHNARMFGYEDPIQPTYGATSATYDKMADYMMRRCLDPPKLESRVMIATHNEDSILKAILLMKMLGIPSSFHKILFGQVYGMCDHVSYSLGQADYRVYKSIPIGPIEDVLVYLSRRAHENNTAFHRLQKEKDLLKQEIKRRILSRS